MVTEKQMNDVLTKFYQDFFRDVDALKKLNKELDDSNTSIDALGYVSGCTYGLELAEGAFLRAYKMACMTKKN